MLSFCLICLFSSALYQRQIVNVKVANLVTSVICERSLTSARLNTFWIHSSSSSHSHHLLHSSQPPNSIILSPQNDYLKSLKNLAFIMTDVLTHCCNQKFSSAIYKAGLIRFSVFPSWSGYALIRTPNIRSYLRHLPFLPLSTYQHP